VKQERESLMATLAALRTDTGKAGGELQQDDITHLRRDLELKLKKLNELTQACAPFAAQKRRSWRLCSTPYPNPAC
jgi:hypothetical protein